MTENGHERKLHVMKEFFYLPTEDKGNKELYVVIGLFLVATEKCVGYGN